jgi:hypothetical protein
MFIVEFVIMHCVDHGEESNKFGRNDYTLTWSDTQIGKR